MTLWPQQSYLEMKTVTFLGHGQGQLIHQLFWKVRAFVTVNILIVVHWSGELYIIHDMHTHNTKRGYAMRQKTHLKKHSYQLFAFADTIFLSK